MPRHHIFKTECFHLLSCLRRILVTLSETITVLSELATGITDVLLHNAYVPGMSQDTLRGWVRVPDCLLSK